MSTIGSHGARITPPDPGGSDGSSAVSATGERTELSRELAQSPELEAIARDTGTIGLNSRGDGVRLVQERLLAFYGDPALLGSTGADAWWGRRSMAACRRFQEEHGLPATGIVDRDTLLALDAATTDDDSAAAASTSTTTTADTLDPAEAKRLMALTLESAVEDGSLGAAELQSAEADIAARYGPDVARKVLLESFGVHAGKLEYTAVDFLQGRVGALDGHVGRYQALLQENLRGAKLLDVDGDGQLDAEDLVFTEGADGTVDVRQVGAALRDELKIAKAMVEASESMDTAGHSFELIRNHRANPAFFKVEDGGTFALKDGVKPADAVRDIFQNPSEYGFECATAMVIVYYKAMLDLIGDNDFNRVAGDLRIGPWEYEGDLRSVKTVTGSGKEEAESSAASGLKPGEYRYIRNWDVSKKGREAGWQGENVIYLGGGKYYGHPFGVASSDTIIAHLNTQRKKRPFFNRLFGHDERRSASLTRATGFMTGSVFDLDRDPNG